MKDRGNVVAVLILVFILVFLVFGLHSIGTLP
jgi:hypothetical protein